MEKKDKAMNTAKMRHEQATRAQGKELGKRNMTPPNSGHGSGNENTEGKSQGSP